MYCSNTCELLREKAFRCFEIDDIINGKWFIVGSDISNGHQRVLGVGELEFGNSYLSLPRNFDLQGISMFFCGRFLRANFSRNQQNFCWKLATVDLVFVQLHISHKSCQPSTIHIQKWWMPWPRLFSWRLETGTFWKRKGIKPCTRGYHVQVMGDERMEIIMTTDGKWHLLSRSTRYEKRFNSTIWCRKT
jgi:hypothetical protein